VQIINNLAADCSISLKVCTEFEHMTPDLLPKFKVKGSEVNGTAWDKISAAKKRYKSAVFKLGENYARAERNTWHSFIRSNIKIAITCRGLLNFAEMVQNFITAQSVYCKCSRLKGRSQGHNVNQWRSSKFGTGERTEVLFLSLPLLSFSLVSPSFPAPPLPLPFLPVLFP